MSWAQINLAICSCGRDVATILFDADGARVICSPHRGGCAAFGAVGSNEAEAARIWNAGLISQGDPDRVEPGDYYGFIGRAAG